MQSCAAPPLFSELRDGMPCSPDPLWAPQGAGLALDASCLLLLSRNTRMLREGERLARGAGTSQDFSEILGATPGQGERCRAAGADGGFVGTACNLSLFLAVLRNQPWSCSRSAWGEEEQEGVVLFKHTVGVSARSTGDQTARHAQPEPRWDASSLLL